MRLCMREDFQKYGQGEIFDEYNSGLDQKDKLICFPPEHTEMEIKNKMNDKNRQNLIFQQSGCPQDPKGKNKARCASDEERREFFSQFQIEARVLQQMFDPKKHASNERPTTYLDTYLY